MPLEVNIEKKLANFTLALKFHAADAPLSILGASGAGKTMLLRCIAGLEKPDHGRIALNGRALFDSERGISLPARERGVGLLFQNYALFPHKTVQQNIAFGLAAVSPEARNARLAQLSARTHVAELNDRYTGELSGGEQQRVALARALAVEPKALLLDEPLSAMDTHLRSQIETLLEETFASYPHPSLVVTHNIEEAYRISADLLVLARGRIVAYGPKQEILRQPPNTEVARLTGCKNISRVQAEPDGSITAIDWGVRLQLNDMAAASARFVGIRAHHICFAKSPETSPNLGGNVIPCWLAHTSETPFRMTVFLRTHELEHFSGEIELQAELTKEEWDRVRGLEQPWQVGLSVDHLFLMDE
ncbi:MAG: sulfate/molybdate ABC transporter ATP-binding protein [Candidatus Acidiferrales bacterium]